MNSVVKEVIGRRHRGTLIEDTVTGSKSASDPGSFCPIGHVPNTQIFDGQLKLTTGGTLEVDRRLQTSVEGVLRLVRSRIHISNRSTSAGIAAAAISATKYLKT